MKIKILEKVTIIVIFQKEVIYLIKGLYEAHLPVSNLQQSIDFYQNLGLKLYKRYDRAAFLWIEEGKSWIGLWDITTLTLCL